MFLTRANKPSPVLPSRRAPRPDRRDPQACRDRLNGRLSRSRRSPSARRSASPEEGDSVLLLTPRRSVELGSDGVAALVQKLQEENDELVAEQAELISKNQRLQAELSRQGAPERLAALERQNAALEAAGRRAAEAEETMWGTIGQLQAEMAALERQNAALEAAGRRAAEAEETMWGTIGQLQAENAALQARGPSVDPSPASPGELEQLQERLQASQAAVGELEEKLAESQQLEGVDGLRAELQASQAAAAAAAEKQAQAEAELQASLAVVAEVEGKRAEAEAALEASKTAQAQAAAELLASRAAQAEAPCSDAVQAEPADEPPATVQVEPQDSEVAEGVGCLDGAVQLLQSAGAGAAEPAVGDHAGGVDELPDPEGPALSSDERVRVLEEMLSAKDLELEEMEQVAQSSARHDRELLWRLRGSEAAVSQAQAQVAELEAKLESQTSQFELLAEPGQPEGLEAELRASQAATAAAEARVAELEAELEAIKAETSAREKHVAVQAARICANVQELELQLGMAGVSPVESASEPEEPDAGPSVGESAAEEPCNRDQAEADCKELDAALAKATNTKKLRDEHDEALVGKQARVNNNRIVWQSLATPAPPSSVGLSEALDSEVAASATVPSQPKQVRREIDSSRSQARIEKERELLVTMSQRAEPEPAREIVEQKLQGNKTGSDWFVDLIELLSPKSSNNTKK